MFLFTEQEYRDLFASSRGRAGITGHHRHCLTADGVPHNTPHSADAAALELGEDLGEEARLGVDPQHVRRQPVDDDEAPVPELLLGVLDEERLQGVRNLVAHVGVGEVQTR